jgi:hypothetical protein
VTQTARTRTRHGARSTTAPRHPRRVSGPLRPLPASAPPIRRGGTGVFERLRALPEHRVLDRLLRGRIWIWLIGVLLGGIVAMQVSLLKLNAGIGRAVTTTATLERQNAAIEGEIARLSSSERVKSAAFDEGMVMPPAGAVEFLRSRGERDAPRAARRMTPPSDEATAVVQNGGREPGVLAAPTTTAAETTLPGTDPATTEPGTDAAVTDTTATAPTTTETPVPATTDPATGAPVATSPETTSTETTVPPAVPDTGAVAAPQG